jgi:hypothetical protein
MENAQQRLFCGMVSGIVTALVLGEIFGGAISRL